MPEKDSKKKNTGLIAGIIAAAVAVVAIIVVVIVIIVANSGVKLVGKWKIDSMTEGGKTVEASALEKLNVKGNIEFKDDKSGSLSLYGETQKFSYDTSKKTITIDGDSRNYKIEDGKLTLEIADGTSITYVKE